MAGHEPGEDRPLSLLPEEALEYALQTARTYVRFRLPMLRARYHQPIDEEDLLDAAGYGAFEAWRTYDPARRCTWPSWLRKRMAWEVSEFLRGYGRDRTDAWKHWHASYRMLSLDENGSSGSTANWAAETIPDETAAFEGRVETRMMMEEYLGVLTERERFCVEQHYLHNRTNGQIGKALGITKSWVGQIVRASLVKMRRAAEGDEG